MSKIYVKVNNIVVDHSGFSNNQPSPINLNLTDLPILYEESNLCLLKKPSFIYVSLGASESDYKGIYEVDNSIPGYTIAYTKLNSKSYILGYKSSPSTWELKGGTNSYTSPKIFVYESIPTISKWTQNGGSSKYIICSAAATEILVSGNNSDSVKDLMGYYTMARYPYDNTIAVEYMNIKDSSIVLFHYPSTGFWGINKKSIPMLKTYNDKHSNSIIPPDKMVWIGQNGLPIISPESSITFKPQDKNITPIYNKIPVDYAASLTINTATFATGKVTINYAYNNLTPNVKLIILLNGKEPSSGSPITLTKTSDLHASAVITTTETGPHIKVELLTASYLKFNNSNFVTKYPTLVSTEINTSLVLTPDSKTYINNCTSAKNNGYNSIMVTHNNSNSTWHMYIDNVEQKPAVIAHNNPNYPPLLFKGLTVTPLKYSIKIIQNI